MKIGSVPFIFTFKYLLTIPWFTYFSVKIYLINDSAAWNFLLKRLSNLTADLQISFRIRINSSLSRFQDQRRGLRYLNNTNNYGSDSRIQFRSSCQEYIAHVEQDGIDTTKLLEEHQSTRYVHRLYVAASSPDVWYLWGKIIITWSEAIIIMSLSGHSRAGHSLRTCRFWLSTYNYKLLTWAVFDSVTSTSADILSISAWTPAWDIPRIFIKESTADSRSSINNKRKESLA